MADAVTNTSPIPSSSDVIKGLDTATQLTNQYVISPIANLGIAGFAFTTKREYRSELKANITDNYNEKNIAIQDNIALEPEIFTLSGYIGEVSVLTTKPKLGGLKSLAQQLTTIAGYLPTITDAAKQLQNAVTSNKSGMQDYLDASLGTGIDLYNTFKKLNPPKTVQAKAYNFLLALRNSRSLVAFDTPYGFKSNYAIMNIVMIQPENTDTKSDIEITLKEIRFAYTSIVPFDASQYQGRSIQQNQPTQNQGSTQGVISTKTSSDLINAMPITIQH